MGKLEGKIALITGGNSGIGLATAKEFANEDAYVFITGRRDAELVAAVKEIRRNVTGVQGDASNLGDLDRVFGAFLQLRVQALDQEPHQSRTLLRIEPHRLFKQLARRPRHASMLPIRRPCCCPANVQYQPRPEAVGCMP
jgi:short subunit dehydrogenase